MGLPTSVSATRIDFSLKGIVMVLVALTILIVLAAFIWKVALPWAERKLPALSKVTGGAGSSQGAAAPRQSPALMGLS